MKIQTLNIKNIRVFKNTGEIEFGDINIFVGKNNSGKSTALRCLQFLQDQKALDRTDIRIGSPNGGFEIGVQGKNTALKYNHNSKVSVDLYTPAYFNIYDRNGAVQKTKLGGFGMSNMRPSNGMFILRANRKGVSLNKNVTESGSKKVTGDFSELVSKIDAIKENEDKFSEYFFKASEEILGIRITTVLKGNGKDLAQKIDMDTKIEIDKMGDGVMHIIGLIADLTLAKNKIFIIEELENDLHPQALKSILELIEVSSKENNNQFFLSTHSNILTKRLGSIEGSKIFHVSSEIDEGGLLFNGMIHEISSTEDRKHLMEDLGFDFFDYDNWDGWLFLEESTAEWLIREFLIPEFTPGLVGRLRTYACNGTGKVKNKFECINNLFTFVHLEPVYKNKAWVLIDGGEEEEKIIEEMKEMYEKSGWDKSNFGNLTKHTIEEYYPPEFKKPEEISETLNQKNKRQAKENLINELQEWIKDNKNKAVQAFKESAKEIIDHLKEIENKLKNK